jgi:galactokinase
MFAFKLITFKNHASKASNIKNLPIHLLLVFSPTDNIFSIMDINRLKNLFEKEFNQSPEIFRAPGRVNIIGEHTDYNDGLVLPFPIEKAIYFAAALSGDNLIHIHALDLDKNAVIDLKNIIQEEPWTRYFIGALNALIEDEYEFKGMNIMVSGDIPFGAGISSSSALTCGFIFVIQQLFNLDISKREIVFIASRAENGTGVNGGKMDQFAICMGEENKAILLDCRDYSYQLIDSEIKGAAWFLFNSMVEHNLAETAYNDRRADCDAALEIMQKMDSHIKSLRDIDLETLDSFSTYLSKTQYERVLHVVNENERVLKMVKKLAENNLLEAGTLLYDSHMSLSKLYEVSCEELDYIVESLRKHPGCFGARMMGGGFGGSVIALLEDKKHDFSSLIDDYKKVFGLEMQIIPVRSKNGISKVE